MTPLEQLALIHSNWVEVEYSGEVFEASVKAFVHMDKHLNLGDPEECVGVLLRSHRLLMAPWVSGGRFRDHDVWVGERHIPFVSAEDFQSDLVKLFERMKVESHIAIKCHVEFERIHPFSDGNGRIGRILMNVHRKRLDLEPVIIGRHSLPDFSALEFRVEDYYKWFNKETS